MEYKDFDPEEEMIDSKGSRIIHLRLLPGFRKEEMRVTMSETLRKLRVRGESPKMNIYYRFNREYYIPSDFDTYKMAAKFDNQILTITIPKKYIPAESVTKASSSSSYPQILSLEPPNDELLMKLCKANNVKIESRTTEELKEAFRKLAQRYPLFEFALGTVKPPA